ncbi:TPR repeat-containing protein [Salinisphaera sp. PC39]|uniref:hypothetical protein n=1 Tax=Salinisphaera sp. PC39 TaxID=1304156 RepID=UPI00333F726B
MERTGAGILAAALVGLLLAGCAQRPVAPPPPDRDAPDAEAPAPRPLPDADEPRDEPAPSSGEQAPPPPRTAADASGPAVLALLGRADEQAAAGELDLAAATVERALNVEPRNPFLYQRLAALRLAQDQPGQTEALARKSNSLAGDNPYVQARNWELIAQSRRMRGDNVGADAASARAEYYRGRTSR